MTYWAGTNIIKSENNDFNWRNNTSHIKNDLMKYFRQSANGKLGAISRAMIGAEKGEYYYIPAAEKKIQKSLGQLSKSKPTKFNGKGNKI